MPVSYDHILKINWAANHLEQLERAVVAWFDGNQHFTHRIEADPDNPAGSLLKVSADDIPVAPCSLVIGDIVQNIRSSLDHMAYALATAYTNPFPQEFARKSQFPIFGDETEKGVPGHGSSMFRDNALPTMIKCIDPRAQTFIEGVQPYQMGANFRDHPLWKLSHLVNTDKHRILHLSAAYAAGYTVRNCVVSGTFTNEPRIVKNDTIAARLGTLRPIDPEKTVEMQVIPNMTIAFSDGLLTNQLVIATLGTITNYVGNEVLTPLQKFL